MPFVVYVRTTRLGRLALVRFLLVLTMPPNHTGSCASLHSGHDGNTYFVELTCTRHCTLSLGRDENNAWLLYMVEYCPKQVEPGRVSDRSMYDVFFAERMSACAPRVYLFYTPKWPGKAVFGRCPTKE